jgi:lysine-N-methylase
MPPGPLQPLFAQKVLVNIASHSGRDYGQMQLHADGSCPFLSSERLCRIQTEYGADHLSSTCATFPRRSRVIDGMEEMSLELSCPEAARQVLLDPHFMQLKKVAARGYARYTPFLRTARELEPANGNRYQYLWEVRYLLLLVLKDRSYPLWQRLFVVGMFCQRLAQLDRPGTGTGADDPRPGEGAVGEGAVK